MASTNYIAYVDESGDEGFAFDGPHRSSEWFVLSAVVTRAENDSALVPLLRNYRATIKKPPQYTIHFRNLRHNQRIPLLHAISQARVRTISVIVHKPSLRDSEYLREKHRLYFYLSRYLFERISWLCKNTAKSPDAARAKVVFSNRLGMSYEDIRNYLRTLRGKTDRGEDIRIDGEVIDAERIVAIPHRLRAGLQVADAVASSVYSAFEPSPYGFTEPRYLDLIRQVTYRHQGTVAGYGIKLFPGEIAVWAAERPEFAWVTGLPKEKAGPGPEDPASS